MHPSKHVVAIILALSVAALYTAMLIGTILDPDCKPGPEFEVIAIKEMTLAIVGGLIAYIGYQAGRATNDKE